MLSLRRFYTRRNVSGMSRRHYFFCSSTCVKVLRSDTFLECRFRWKVKIISAFSLPKNVAFFLSQSSLSIDETLAECKTLFLSIIILFHQMQPYHFIIKLKNVSLIFQLTSLINFWLWALLKYSILHLVNYVATTSLRNRLA